MKSAYKDAGVDIYAGNRFVERIKPHVKMTSRSGVMSGIGGFGAFFDPAAAGYSDPVLVSSTDGVGTKIRIAIDTGIYDSIGIDLVAMCVNDLIVQGAEPLFFLDYLACGRLDVDTAENLVRGIAKGCSMAGCALIGGETAEMPGMYAEGDYDLAGFSVGAVERGKVIDGSDVREGDVIIGIASGGLHSNGYSLVRKIMADKGLEFSARASFMDEGVTLGEAFLEPTKIYVRTVLETLVTCNIKAMANITGGGLLENIPRAVPDHLAANIDAEKWLLPGIFSWLAETGELDSDDLAGTFNCGIGMILICPPEEKTQCIKVIEDSGERAFYIGDIEKRDAQAVSIKNMAKAWKK
jgi:phosphoribosylformylglycinamidine cyclo-ligase